LVLKVARRGEVPPFIVMDVMRAANERVAAGHDVLHLEVGQPGTPAPLAVRDAAKSALDGDRLGYTDAFGLPPLRQRIADYYRDRYGADVDPARIVVTTGSSGGFVLSFLAAFDPGDRVALVEPGYPAYRNILAALGIEAVGLPVGAAERYQPSVSVIEAYRRRGGLPLDGLIVASPSNPTGSVIDPDAFRDLTAYCRAEGIRLISDEIYHGISYGMETATAAALDPSAVVINSFSKYFSMTGWRLGWMVLPPDLLRSVECLGQNLFISPPTLSQHAGIAAFDCRVELDGMVAAYRRSRDHLMGVLPAAGISEVAPTDGAFYLYADVRHLTNDSVSFCRRMLEEIGVAMTPGPDFDPHRGAGTLRISYAAAETDIAEAARRLTEWLPRQG